MIGNLEPEERLLNLESDELQADLAEIYNDIERLAFRIYMTGYNKGLKQQSKYCLLYTSPSPRDATLSRMPSSA